MKKYLIGGAIFAVLSMIHFGVFDRLPKKAAAWLDSTSELDFDRKGANKAADRTLEGMADVRRALEKGRTQAAARALVAARVHLQIALAHQRGEELRDGKTVGAWYDEAMADAGRSFAAILQAGPPADATVIDLTGLFELTATIKQPQLDAAVPAYLAKVQKSATSRAAVISVEFSRFTEAFHGPMLDLLAQRAGADRRYLVVVGGAASIQPLPNFVGSVLIQFYHETPDYLSEDRSHRATGMNLIQSARLELKPDTRLAASTTWKQALVLTHRETPAARYTFGDGQGKIDPNGRPVTRSDGPGSEHFAGTKEHFVAAWTRHFWTRFQPELAQIPVL